MDWYHLGTVALDRGRRRLLLVRAAGVWVVAAGHAVPGGSGACFT